MVTISVQNAYYIFSVVAVLCGASYLFIGVLENRG
jgi:hypothetical protein